MRKQDTYKEVRKLEYPNGVTYVYIPDLTPEEYGRRHRILEKAVVSILLDQERAHRLKAAE